MAHPTPGCSLSANCSQDRRRFRSQESGLILPPGRADLLLLSANPGEDIRNLRKVALRLTAGEIAR